MKTENKIKELNLELPNAADPVGSYLASKVSGKLLFISGQISMNDKGELIKGKLGKELNTEAGYNAAKRCGLSIIAQAKKACSDDLNRIKSCIKLTGFVNSTDNFIEQPKVTGVQNLGIDGITLRLVAKTDPSEQWAVARELRIRIKEAFDSEGIEMPFPQRTVWIKQEK